MTDALHFEPPTRVAFNGMDTYTASKFVAFSVVAPLPTMNVVVLEELAGPRSSCAARGRGNAPSPSPPRPQTSTTISERPRCRCGSWQVEVFLRRSFATEIVTQTSAGASESCAPGECGRLHSAQQQAWPLSFSLFIDRFSTFDWSFL